LLHRTCPGVWHPLLSSLPSPPYHRFILPPHCHIRLSCPCCGYCCCGRPCHLASASRCFLSTWRIVARVDLGEEGLPASAFSSNLAPGNFKSSPPYHVNGAKIPLPRDFFGGAHNADFTAMDCPHDIDMYHDFPVMRSCNLLEPEVYNFLAAPTPLQ
jgi:hypothetical protein